MGCNRLGTKEDKEAVREAQEVARCQSLAPDCSYAEVKEAYERGGEAAVLQLQAEKAAQRFAGQVHAYSELKHAFGGIMQQEGFQIEVHHLIEQRFCDALGWDPYHMPAVVLPRDASSKPVGLGGLPDHDTICEMIKAEIRVGTDYDSLSVDQIRKAHETVYERLGRHDWIQEMSTFWE